MARNALGKTKSRNTQSSTREDEVAERRQSLLDAAVAVIAQKGLIGTTISSIATEAECSYGLVSFHFNSKEGIILAALDYLVDEYDKALNRNSRTAFTRIMTTVPENALVVSHLSKSVAGPDGSLTILQQMDFTVRTGESIAIVGASGSGKTIRRCCGSLKDSPLIMMICCWLAPVCYPCRII